MKKTLLTSLVLCLCSQVALCQVQQGALKVMIENADEDGIIGAQVAVYQGEKLMTGGATDPFGLAFIPSIVAGEYLVEVSSIGFGRERRVVQIHTNNITSISFRLEPTYSDYAFDCCGCPRRPKEKKPSKPRKIIASNAWSVLHPTFGFNTNWQTEEILKMPVR